MQAPTFDRAKFKDLVHYICENCEVAELGAVKLHKVLYFSDMLFYAQTGRPITGATYKKRQFGPVAAFLLTALSELEAEERIEIKEVDFYGFKKKEFIAKEEFRSNMLSDEEKAFVDDIIQAVCKERTARQISELSHHRVWEMAAMGEELPYFTVFQFSPVEVSDDDVAWGKAEVERLASAGYKSGSLSGQTKRAV